MEINIKGGIGEFQEEGSPNVTDSDSLNRALEGISPTEEIVLLIASPGGSVFEGFNMYNTLRSLPNRVTAEVSTAMSIATLIALAADRVKMNEVGRFMIHRASSMAMGNAEDLEKEAEVLKSIDDTLISVYSAKTGKSMSEIEQLMDDTTWYTAKDSDGKEGALSAGFIDEIINPVSEKIAAMYNIKNKKSMNKFKSLFNSFRAELGMEEVAEETTEEVVETPANVETPEAVAEESTEESSEETAEYVTMKQFNEFMEIVQKMAEAIEENQASSAQEAVDQLKTGLKRSNAQPPKANASMEGNESKAWVDPHARFRAEMDEINKKNRQ